MALDGGAPSPAASTAAPSDLLNLDNSPQKRGRVEQPQVTMDALRDLFRGELQIAVGQLNEKVGKLEVAMQAQRAEVTDQIGEVKEECRGQREHLSAVSTKDAHRQARAKWHQRGTGKGTSPDNRRMAPGLRGDQGHRAGQQVRCRAKVGHFYMRDTFVPGLRRGYAIVPLHRKEGETESEQRQRVQHCIKHVCNANLTVDTKDNGAPSKLFLNISQPPEKRRKVQVAAKCKRLLMEQGALAADVEVEYATGQVWLKGTRVAAASVTAHPPNTTPTGTQGWIDLQTIASKLHHNIETIRTAWQPLGAMLR